MSVFQQVKRDQSSAYDSQIPKRRRLSWLPLRRVSWPWESPKSGCASLCRKRQSGAASHQLDSDQILQASPRRRSFVQTSASLHRACLGLKSTKPTKQKTSLQRLRLPRTHSLPPFNLLRNCHQNRPDPVRRRPVPTLRTRTEKLQLVRRRWPKPWQRSWSSHSPNKRRYSSPFGCSGIRTRTLISPPLPREFFNSCRHMTTGWLITD
mmetsp:Transcript_72166/g.169118  ORF Transcript_72166/g.169118 Transcript_72166/m.169118 type:complete len:208 (-) Transcript_72166:25-648(-)